MGKYIDSVDPKAAAKLIKLRCTDGLKWKEVLAKQEIGYARGELIVFEHEFEQAKMKTIPATPENVVYLRTELGLSWGAIMVWCAAGEAVVRRAFKDGAKVHSDGQRVGKGGRWKFDDQALYVGELKPTGTDIPADQKLVREVARDCAVTQRLMKMEFAELKAFAIAQGVIVKPKTTKAKLALEVKKLVSKAVSEKQTEAKAS